jgi:NAD(P)-dependent dehydrogenase (short-subunit alcohol dehydrogenase family)
MSLASNARWSIGRKHLSLPSIGTSVGRKESASAVGVLDRFRLDGKVALVTGASSGLGVAFVRALAEAGANVGIGARRVDRLQATSSIVEQIGRKAVVQQLDVTDPSSCESFVQSVRERLGRIDILVNNAGVGAVVPAVRETPGEFRAVIETNLLGAYWMSQSCARVMQPGSSIVNIGSALGLTTAGLPQAAYSTSKAGLIGLTRDLAQQWTSRRGIRVNLIAPGFFPSEMTDEYPTKYLKDIVSDRVPMGRLGEVEELAAAVVYFASDGSSFVTGAVLPVDGGLLIT